MTEVSVWRARGYWALATVLLPLVNPVLFAFGSFATDSDGFEAWLPVLVLICVANWGLMRLIGGRLWRSRAVRAHRDQLPRKRLLQPRPRVVRSSLRRIAPTPRAWKRLKAPPGR